MMTELLKTVPHILRARGYRLYTQKGTRLVDLWLNGGRSLLGHTPPNVLRELKNTASRGLYAPYPHFSEGRLIKALNKLLPGYYFKILSQSSLRHKEHGEELKIWRPFTNPDSSKLELILPIPLDMCVIAYKDEAELPPSDILPPLTLATAARGVYDLIAAPERANPKLPRTYKALKESNCPWQREGIYLTLKEDTISKDEWAALFNKFLEAGFLLPPTPEDPLILPGEMSDGEDAKLAKVLIS